MSYIDDTAPGHGALPPRAAFTSDAPTLDLGEQWGSSTRRAGEMEPRAPDSA